jgi:type I restriction enzyme, S subunit
MSNNTLIPSLRFPEFKNEGEWEEKLLESVGNVVASGDLDENTFSPTKTSVHIYPVYSNSVSQEGIYGYSSAFKYKSDCVTITARGTLGVAFERKTEFVGIGRLLVISELQNTNANFLKENWNYKAKVPLENGGIPQLTAVKAKSISLLFPKLPEQQKIADCLSSLDEVITAHSQKLELLKQHKKGLMQNLFPQEGAKVPKYRFKEFENDGEWVEKKLGEVCKMQAGKFVSASAIMESNNVNLFPCYGGNGLRGYTNTFTHTGVYSLIGRQGALCGNVTLTKGRFHATEHAVVVTPESNVDTIWLFYGLELMKLNQYATGQAQPGLSVSNLEQVELSLPKNIKEQQKIAECLSTIDVLITAQAERIEQLKLHKKGLMQGLFPNIPKE